MRDDVSVLPDTAGRCVSSDTVSCLGDVCRGSDGNDLDAELRGSSVLQFLYFLEDGCCMASGFDFVPCSKDFSWAVPVNAHVFTSVEFFLDP